MFLNILNWKVIRLLWFAYCWEALEISFLLVVVLSEFELYWHSYVHLKACKIYAIDSYTMIHFCTCLGKS